MSETAKPVSAAASRAAVLGTLPFVLAAATRLAAVDLVGSFALEQIAATPVRTLGDALGVEVVVWFFDAPSQLHVRALVWETVRR